jgi:hypothetical protein
MGRITEQRGRDHRQGRVYRQGNTQRTCADDVVMGNHIVQALGTIFFDPNAIEAFHRVHRLTFAFVCAHLVVHPLRVDERRMQWRA